MKERFMSRVVSLAQLDDCLTDMVYSGWALVGLYPMQSKIILIVFKRTSN